MRPKLGSKFKFTLQYIGSENVKNGGFDDDPPHLDASRLAKINPSVLRCPST
jgi:hypothetical protein